LIKKINMTSSDWVDSSSACKILGVRRQTLYAYVSRKMVRTCADAADARRSLYSRADVEALARRSSRPRARAYVAAGAIRWGDPVLATSVSGVRDGELYFGAMNACDCAASMSLEDIAAHHYRAAQFLAPSIESPIPPGDTPLNRALHYLAEESDASEPVMGRDRQAHALDGMRLLTGFVDALLGERRNGPAHARLKAAWGLNDRSAEAVRRALVLLSDHELNPSTFAVRVCASTGASLPASLLAGLATLSGPLHGGVCRRASEAIRAASTSEAALEAFLADAGETSAYGYGFGHPLYPEGDPRAACLLEDLDPFEPSLLAMESVAKRVGQRPNIDAALAVLVEVHRWPEDAAFLIFAIGRMTGWIAHAIEQAENGSIIRPRARYLPCADPIVR